MQWIFDRLKEPSTWQGIAAFFTAVGVMLSPELWATIGPAGVAIVALIQVIKKERAAKPE